MPTHEENMREITRDYDRRVRDGIVTITREREEVSLNGERYLTRDFSDGCVARYFRLPGGTWIPIEIHRPAPTSQAHVHGDSTRTLMDQLGRQVDRLAPATRDGMNLVGPSEVQRADIEDLMVTCLTLIDLSLHEDMALPPWSCRRDGKEPTGEHIVRAGRQAFLMFQSLRNAMVKAFQIEQDNIRRASEKPLTKPLRRKMVE